MAHQNKKFFNSFIEISAVLIAPILPSVHNKGYQGLKRFNKAGLAVGFLYK
jgi:hypothetical protein